MQRHFLNHCDHFLHSHYLQVCLSSNFARRNKILVTLGKQRTIIINTSVLLAEDFCIASTRPTSECCSHEFCPSGFKVKTNINYSRSRSCYPYYIQATD